MYDVTTRHLLEPADDFVETAAKQVMQIHCSGDGEGDVLVFMPGKSGLGSQNIHAQKLIIQVPKRSRPAPIRYDVLLKICPIAQIRYVS
jgi:ATP-dependent RNA helicase DHX33